MKKSLLLKNARLFQNGIWTPKSLVCELGKIVLMEDSSPSMDGFVLDLQGKRLLPGLVNSHEHLLASYLPKVGGKEKHQTWLSYDNLYKSSGTFAERQQIDPELLYYLGAYKNLLSGVTTVFDHIPHAVQNPFRGVLPIKLVTEYCLSHSIGTYSLGWGEGPALEYRMAANANIPYVTHLAEGLDEDSKQALRKLEKMDALGPYSVLVHCLPFGPKEADLIAQKEASVVWCPTSNLHIFGKTTNIKLFLERGVNVCLGTDFSPSGALNLLEEISLAKSIYQTMYEEELSEDTLLSMVSTNPRKAFRLGNPNALVPGLSADFLILSGEQPLSQTKPEDIFLVVIDGLPVFGDVDTLPVFQNFQLDVEEIQIHGKSKWVAGSPKRLMKEVSESLGYKKDLAFLPIYGK